MKTAMTELIDWIAEIENSVFALSAEKNELAMLSQFKLKAKELLQTEKEQLISMCSIGSRNPGIEGEEVFKTAFRKIKSNEQ